MGLTTAERNRRKRERKKREREEQRKKEEELRKEQEEEKKEEKPTEEEDVEIEYVAEAPMVPQEGQFEALRRFEERVSAVITDDEKNSLEKGSSVALIKDELDEEDDESKHLSKRKLREMLRPSVAELKRRVERPDLVEAHDVTAADPEFLIQLKAVPGSVPVPRHWGRKRKYLQGKVRFICSMQERALSSNVRRKKWIMC